MKNVLLDNAKFPYSAFQWKINATSFSPAFLMRFQCLANMFYYIVTAWEIQKQRLIQ